MNDRQAEESRRSSSVERPTWLLQPVASGGFVLEPAGGDPIKAVPAAEGWTISSSGTTHDARLKRPDDGKGGFVLLAADGVTESGRSSRLTPGTVADGPSHVLLDDGRLFCVALTGPADTGIELRGWETPGAYLVARPGEGGWRISSTPAGSGLEEVEALSIIFAAEILDAGRELG